MKKCVGPPRSLAGVYVEEQPRQPDKRTGGDARGKSWKGWDDSWGLVSAARTGGYAESRTALRHQRDWRFPRRRATGFGHRHNGRPGECASGMVSFSSNERGFSPAPSFILRRHRTSHGGEVDVLLHRAGVASSPRLVGGRTGEKRGEKEGSSRHPPRRRLFNSFAPCTRQLTLPLSLHPAPTAPSPTSGGMQPAHTQATAPRYRLGARKRRRRERTSGLEQQQQQQQRQSLGATARDWAK